MIRQRSLSNAAPSKSSKKPSSALASDVLAADVLAADVLAADVLAADVLASQAVSDPVSELAADVSVFGSAQPVSRRRSGRRSSVFKVVVLRIVDSPASSCIPPRRRGGPIVGEGGLPRANTGKRGP